MNRETFRKWYEEAKKRTGSITHNGERWMLTVTNGRPLTIGFSRVVTNQDGKTIENVAVNEGVEDGVRVSVHTIFYPTAQGYLGIAVRYKPSGEFDGGNVQADVNYDAKRNLSGKTVGISITRDEVFRLEGGAKGMGKIWQHGNLVTVEIAGLRQISFPFSLAPEQVLKKKTDLRLEG